MTIKHILGDMINNRLNGENLNEAVSQKSIAEAIFVLIGTKNGVKFKNKFGNTDKEVSGSIDISSLDAIHSSFIDKMDFKVRIEKAPDGSDNYIIFNLEYKWEYKDGGRNGHRLGNYYVGIFDGKVTSRTTQANMIQMASKKGWS